MNICPNHILLICMYVSLIFNGHAHCIHDPKLCHHGNTGFDDTFLLLSSHLYRSSTISQRLPFRGKYMRSRTSIASFCRVLLRCATAISARQNQSLKSSICTNTPFNLTATASYYKVYHYLICLPTMCRALYSSSMKKAWHNSSNATNPIQPILLPCLHEH